MKRREMKGSLPALQTVPCVMGIQERLPGWPHGVPLFQALEKASVLQEAGWSRTGRRCLRWNRRQRGMQAGAARSKESQSQPSPSRPPPAKRPPMREIFRGEHNTPKQQPHKYGPIIKSYVHPYVHSSTIHNSQDMETT